MGQQEITATQTNSARLREFMRALLADVHALERMIEERRFETGVRRIGAEQEMFLVDSGMRAANVATEVLAKLDPKHFTHELGLFNLEANMTPYEMGPDCLAKMEAELDLLTAQARRAAAECGAEVLLVGILPTLELEDLELSSMTPSARFAELNRVMSELCGGEFRTLIKGLDELRATHDNVMLESCNTSFQVHFQVAPEEFATLYNLAQAVIAPVLAAGVNSPVMLQHRLWHETRVALFQQSLDVRSKAQQARGTKQRVTFGSRWIERSALEIFREDIARFRVLIGGELDEDPMGVLDRGEIPRLRALCLHNGTVYRWNRPCYGVKDGVAHLRIESRAFPAGPTVLDEVANSAFFFGLMSALGEEYGEIHRYMDFDHAHANFMAAARYGLNARLTWIHGRVWAAEQLILERLLPKAREGLRGRGVDEASIDRYLGVVEERVRSNRTGAQWALDSLSGMGDAGTRDERYRVLTSCIAQRQWDGVPCHRWALASLDESRDWRHSYRTVGQVMSTDLFTVHPEDLVDLAANLMDWEHVRHVPVEDHDGRLVGIVSHRRLLRLLGRGLKEGERQVAVREIMKPDPITVSPDAPTLAAIHIMRDNKVSALPVVQDGRLVGIVTEHDFIRVAASLLEEKLSEPM